MITLADIYDDQGLFAKAKPIYEHVLDLRQNSLGLNHPDVAYTCNSLGINRMHLKDFGTGTEHLFRRAIDIYTSCSGPKTSNHAAALGNLGTLLAHRKDYQGAIDLQTRALAIEESLLGKRHPDIANTLYELSETFRKGNKKAEAIEYMKRARDIYEQTLTESHPLSRRTKGELEELIKSPNTSDTSTTNQSIESYGNPLSERAQLCIDMDTAASRLIKRQVGYDSIASPPISPVIIGEHS